MIATLSKLPESGKKVKLILVKSCPKCGNTQFTLAGKVQDGDFEAICTNCKTKIKLIKSLDLLWEGL